ncbi:MAG: response regulator transcription factor [Anaerolineales bacterium]|nr:response regulator transcription factor [Anaerolineales bacterium]
MAKKILVVEDEKKLVTILKAYLEQAGFAVVTAPDGQQALTMFRHEKPALVLLDLNLPVLDGLDVCRALRKESAVPIIMITARVEETDRLIGLELGADDYISKPFSPREVVARVRAVLRRSEGEPTRAETLSADELMLDLTKHSARFKDHELELTPTEFDLLVVLMQNPGRAFTRLQLLDRVQGEAFDGYERTIDAHIKNLRQKIERDPKNPRYLLTVFGVGYKFAEDA